MQRLNERTLNRTVIHRNTQMTLDIQENQPVALSVATEETIITKD